MVSSAKVTYRTVHLKAGTVNFTNQNFSSISAEHKILPPLQVVLPFLLKYADSSVLIPSLLLLSYVVGSEETYLFQEHHAKT